MSEDSHSIQNVGNFIIEFIQSNTFNNDSEINDETDIVSNELLDSFAMLSLIMSLEIEFSVKFKMEELADKSIRDINSLKLLVLDKINLSINND